jgi:hypothetical protein
MLKKFAQNRTMFGLIKVFSDRSGGFGCGRFTVAFRTALRLDTALPLPVKSSAGRSYVVRNLVLRLFFEIAGVMTFV